MHPEQSIFASLHKWARGQDENYCTEGLIYLLRLMLLEAPTQALEVIEWLTDGVIKRGSVAKSISISGQINSDSGRPDLEITCWSAKAWIEAKVDSQVGPDQLERYRRDLGSHPERRLILLSHGFDVLEEHNQPDAYRRWIELADKLEMALRSFGGMLSKATILLDDYLAFLALKQMRLNTVTPNVSQSINDVGTLITQIKLACHRAGLKPTPGRSEFILGYYLWENNECVGWIGFQLMLPQWLSYFTDTKGYGPEVDLMIAAQSQLPGSEIVDKHWTNSIDLIGCTEYLNASPADQVEFLRKHLVESVAAFRGMLKNRVA